MRYFNLKKNKFFCPIINLDKLWTLVGEEVRLAYQCCHVHGLAYC